MIERKLLQTVLDRLTQFPAVILLGPRQVGKTTLAQTIGERQPSTYLDLESRQGREKLSDPALFLSAHEDKLVILDEIQFMPELFMELRGVIDRGIRRGKRTGQFLILGSASIDLLKQSSESLAGRVVYVELHPFNVLEVKQRDYSNLWIRGGFPSSLLAEDEMISVVWRENFIKTYLERDIPQLGPRIPAETLHRFWTMLAHTQGQLFNAAQFARSLSVDGKTVARYLDLMVDLLLVRRLLPYHESVKKRLVKSPKIYLRDSGLVHTLLGLEDHDAVFGHPVVGDSWEGFVIENILRITPDRTRANFYRTAAGAEVDLVLQIPNLGLWLVEVKLGFSPKISRGFYSAREDLEPDRSFIVCSGEDRYPKSEGVEVIGLGEICKVLSDLREN